MKKIIITQRIEKLGEHNELRENVDTRLISLVDKLGYMPILIPNNLVNIKKFINEISPSGIILSGGGDPRVKNLRYQTEKKLIKISLKKDIPTIGLCRGAQAINLFFGGKLLKVKNHVRRNHRIFGTFINNKKIIVNSYHNYGFYKDTLGKKLNLLANSSDKVVKLFTHKNYKILGIMWHPERYSKIRDFDKNLIKKFFKN
jgi:N5-(cytidine 5'-diphosphoramidyl)-L-glutamine hydrolase